MAGAERGSATGQRVLFFADAAERAGVQPRRPLWRGVKEAGRRRIARMGLRRDLPVVPRWTAALLALLGALACGVGGANTGFLAALAAQASLQSAATIFISARPPQLPLRRVGPVVAGLLLFLAWAAVPGLAGVCGLGDPLLAPDRFWPAWLGAAGLVAVFLAAALAGLRPGNGGAVRCLAHGPYRRVDCCDTGSADAGAARGLALCGGG